MIGLIDQIFSKLVYPSFQTVPMPNYFVEAHKNVYSSHGTTKDFSAWKHSFEPNSKCGC